MSKKQQLKPERLDAEELIALIKRVNPTDRGLPSVERDRRYREKSSLQSLLIRRFGEELRVERDGDAPDLVLIRHPALRLPCGHALVSELDEDAASWVRMQLDLGGEEHEPEQEEQASRGAQSDELSLLQQGAAALEEYDYERARELFEAAFEESGGDVIEARALLELLVDSLGADQDALQLVGELSPRAKSDALVRTLLAQACVRTGDARSAIAWLKGVDSPRCAELLGHILVEAAEQGQSELIEIAMVQLKLRAPGHPALTRARELLQSRREKQRAPEEDAIRRLVEAHDLVQAESKARELLDRFPESEVARDAVVRAERERSRVRAAELLRQAGEDGVETRPEQVAALAREVIATGTTDEMILREARGLLARAEERSRERRISRKIERVVSLLAEGVSEQALQAYGELPPEARAQVRSAVKLEGLDWMEQAGASTRRVVGAIAQMAAVARLADDDPERLLEAVQSYEEVLTGVDAARKLLAQARESRRQRRGEQARAATAAARERLAAGCADEATAILEAMDPQWVLPQDRADWESVRQATRDASQKLEAERKIRLETNPVRAIAMARQLAEDATSEDERRRWMECIDQLRKRLDDDWHVMRFGAGNAGQWLALLGPEVNSDSMRRYVRCEAETIVVGQTAGAWVFVFEVETTRVAVVGGIVFKLPERPGEVADLVVEDNRIWVFGDKGCALQLALPGWELSGWWPKTELNPRGEMIEGITLLPGGRTLSVVVFEDKHPAVRLVDAMKWEGRRSLDDSGPLIPLIGSKPSMSLVRRKDDSVSILDARGMFVPGRRVPIGRFPKTAAIAPDGIRFVVATAVDDGVLTSQVRLLVVDASGAIVQSVRLEDTSAETGIFLASSVEEGILYCHVGVLSEKPELIGFVWEGSGFSRAWRMPCPDGMLVVQDERSSRARAMVRSAEGPRFVTLGRDAPTLPASTPDPRGPLPNLGPGSAPCQMEASELDAWSTEKYETLDRVSDRELDEIVSEGERSLRDGLAIWRMLMAAARLDHADRLMADLRKAHPSEPIFPELEADQLAILADWPGVRRVLETVDPTSLSPARRRHHHHMLGMALAAAGEAEAAVEELERGAAEPGQCPLDVWIDVMRIPSPIGRETTPTAPDSVASRIVAALWSAWWCMGQGDLDGALAAVDREELWLAREQNCTAWLAKVLLARAHAGCDVGLETPVALAHLLSVRGTMPTLRRCMPVPLQLRIAEQELAQLAGDAASWLSTHKGRFSASS